MKIAIVAKLWEEVSSKSTGGTGVFLGNLTNGLIKKGHSVFLFATGNSKTKAKLFAVIDKPFTVYSESIHYLNISEAFRRNSQFDIIHCCVDHTATFFSSLVNIPSLHTIDYGDLFDDDIKVLKHYSTLNYSAVSKAVYNFIPSLNWQGVVHHGIEVDDFEFNLKPKDYLLFLGRLSPQKGADVAIKMAKKLGSRLILAGKMVEIDKDYLNRKVKPFIDGNQIKYFGVANYNQKKELLKNAKVLLHPVDYLEAFGLTLIESMACGTPVIAFRRGAVPEIIIDGKTGFIVDNIDEMVGAIKKIDQIDRKYCREHVENNFTVEKMVDGYEEVYKKLKNNQNYAPKNQNPMPKMQKYMGGR